MRGSVGIAIPLILLGLLGCEGAPGTSGSATGKPKEAADDKGAEEAARCCGRAALLDAEFARLQHERGIIPPAATQPPAAASERGTPAPATAGSGAPAVATAGSAAPSAPDAASAGSGAPAASPTVGAPAAPVAAPATAQPVPSVINTHEHMLSVDQLDGYLAAARSAGISSTVMVASPDFTLYGKGNDKGEPSMSENFDRILVAARRHPGEIIPFAAIDPRDPDKLDRLKRHVQAGAKGAKLYNGHSNFYDKPLDDQEMDPVFAYIEQTGLPLCWHVNVPQYFEEFSRVMQRHPQLNVQVVHYGVAFWRPKTPGFEQFKQMLRTYPNMYTDTSLGTRKILIDGLAVIGKHRQLFVDFFKEFGDRVTFGTDGVVTANVEKSTDWWAKVIGACRDQLETEAFYFPMGAGYSKYWHKGLDPAGIFVGLALPPDTLRKVYTDNARRWLTPPPSKG